MAKNGLDDSERKILASLIQDSSKSQKEINNSTGLTTTKVSRSITDLKSRGIIKKYTIEVDYTKIGYPVSAFFFFEELKKSQDATYELLNYLTEIDEIVEIYSVLGKGYDFVLKLMCDSNESVIDIVKTINGQENVNSETSYTCVVGNTEKIEPGPPI